MKPLFKQKKTFLVRRIFLIFSVVNTFSLISFADDCSEWFQKLKIKNSADCESKCLTSPTDMSSYSCTEKCDILCKRSVAKDFSGDENFYGLTDSEIAFCNENKAVCLKAYKLSWKAESLCLSIYPKSGHNDESDACRHYIWGILLSQGIGERDSEIILNAHENNLKEAQNERSMDLANNRQSQIDYLKLKKSDLDDQEIVSKFKENLKNKKFIIITPSYPAGGLP